MLDIAEKKDIKGVASVVVSATTNVPVLLDNPCKALTPTTVDSQLYRMKEYDRCIALFVDPRPAGRRPS